MTAWEDSTCHPGCEDERGADGCHRAQFCVFCLRKIGDDAQLRLAELEAAAEALIASVPPSLRTPYHAWEGFLNTLRATQRRGIAEGNDAK